MKELDFFGSIVGFTYKDGHSTYKSSVGGVFYCLIFCIALAMTALYGIKYISRDSPIMNAYTDKFAQPPQIDMSKLNLAVMMQYFGRKEFHFDVFSVNVSYVQVNNTNGLINKTYLTQKECSEEMISKSETKNNNLQLSNALCIDTNGTSIKGSQADDFFSYLSVEISLCIDRPECMDSTKLKDYIALAQPSAYIYFNDYVFQPTNKTNLVNSFTNFFDLFVTYNNYKISNAYFSQYAMNVDTSFFFSGDVTTLSEIVFDSFRDSVSVRTENQNISGIINIMASKNVHVINISYLQLSQVLANIGAVVGNIYLIFQAIVRRVNHALFENEMIESLVTIRNEADVKIDIPRNDDFSSNKLKDSNVLNFPINLGVSRTHLKIQQPFNRRTSKEIRFSNWDYVCTKVRPCRKNTNKVIDQLNEKLKKLLNYSNLYKRIQELETVKYLILNNNQRGLISFIKPEIMISKNNSVLKVEDGFSKYYLENEFGNDVEKAKTAYYKMYNMIEKTELDKQILNLVDNVIR